jgi:carbonic anhydrase
MNIPSRTIATAALALAFTTWAVAKPKTTPAAEAPAPAAHADVPRGPAPEKALKMLRKGNDRFTKGKPEHPRQDETRRKELTDSQHPFASILGCADSRVSPEVIFDQGIGDLFVVRIAGNIIDDAILASIEYSVEHLGSRLIVVLGHEGCGAVKAARDTIAAGEKAPRHLRTLVAAIAPAVKATAKKELDATVRLNVLNVVDAIAASKPVLACKIRDGDVKVVGARYDLDSGEVELLSR